MRSPRSSPDHDARRPQRSPQGTADSERRGPTTDPDSGAYPLPLAVGNQALQRMVKEGGLAPVVLAGLGGQLGNQAVQRLSAGTLPREAASGAAANQSPVTVARQSGSPVTIQRFLDVNNAQVASLSTAWHHIQHSNYQPQGGWTTNHRDRLKLWVKRSATYGSMKWYMTAQSWTFNDWDEAAEALDSHVRAQANRNREKQLAQEARKSTTIRTNLGTALQTIEGWITNTFPGQIVATDYHDNQHTYNSVWTYLEQFHGQYRHWYPNGKVRARMQNPSTNHVSTNFVILREVFYALYSIDTANAQVPTSVRPGGNRHGTGGGGQVRIDKNAPQGETRRDDFTPESNHPWVQHARTLAMPLGAGASNTTDGILYMANLAGVDGAGKEAIAWAAFVFWNRRYFKIQGYGHTFHEVMDVAHEEHGVAYTAGQYPAHAP